MDRAICRQKEQFCSITKPNCNFYCSTEPLSTITGKTEQNEYSGIG